MNFFLKYWSQLIATIAFLLSLWSAFHTYKLTHLKPEAVIKWINEVKDGKSSQFNVCLSVFNGSSKPVSIRKVFLNNYLAVDFPLVLVSDGNSTIYTDDLPINIDPFKSCNFVIAFQYVTAGELHCQGAIKLIYDSNKSILVNTSPFSSNINSQEMIKRLNAYRVKK